MSARTEFDALKNGLSGIAGSGYTQQQEKANIDMGEYEEFVPPEKIPFNMISQTANTYNHEIGGHEGQDEPQTFQSTNHVYEEQKHHSIAPNDEALWPGGPLVSEIESWKKQFADIYMADDIDPNTIFIYRTINRYEYKAIIATPNTDPLMREEMICEQCVLFPYEYSYGMMSNGNAGNVTTLAEHILTSSGFTKASVPRRL